MKRTFLLALSLFAFVTMFSFSADAWACGGWWDPCCGGSWSEDRCAAFQARVRQRAAENENYFKRRKDELTALSLILPGLAGKAAAAAAYAAGQAADANGIVARGEYVPPPSQQVVQIVSASPGYIDYEFYWPNEVANDADVVLLDAQQSGQWSAGYRECRTGGNEDDVCWGYKYNANWWLWQVGDAHYWLAVSLNNSAYELELWYADDPSAAWAASIMRDMANLCNTTGFEYES